MINRQLQEDLLVTALEGGSNYWYFIPDIAPLDGIAEGEPLSIRLFKAVMDHGKEILVYDIEDDNEYHGKISRDSINGATKLMARESPEHMKSVRDDEWDAESADVWFQYVVRGEVVFG